MSRGIRQPKQLSTQNNLFHLSVRKAAKGATTEETATSREAAPATADWDACRACRDRSVLLSHDFRLQLRGKGPKIGPHGQHPEIIGPMKKMKSKKQLHMSIRGAGLSETWLNTWNVQGAHYAREKQWAAVAMHNGL